MYQLFDEKRGVSHALTGLIKEIGRSEKCDISYPEDTSLSRVHARIDRDGDAWMLVDLDSTNGTYVNGERVTEVKLQPGDMIEIGDANLRFIPMSVNDQSARKKTTNITIRKSLEDPTDSNDEAKGFFDRVKTALKKRE